jgi:putative membrane protein
MSDPKILRKATFDKTVCTYWLLSGTISLIICVVTIPLIPFWWIFGLKVTRKYLDLMSCTLTEKTLIVKKGWLNRIEKTIPLEKITDLALRQGPIMRAMNLKALSVETAGSSGGTAGGALVALVGIEDTVGFRDSVLAQRDLLASNTATQPSSPPTDESTLEEIRDTLHRIEQSMKVTS